MYQRYFLVVAYFAACVISSAKTTVGNYGNLTATVRDDGNFYIRVTDFPYRLKGAMGQGGSCDLTTGTGTDAVGDFQEINCNYTLDVPRQAGIRVYNDKPVVIFTDVYSADGTNSAPFPSITVLPQNPPYQLTFKGIFARYNFSCKEAGNPCIFFDDDANTFILSAASHFPMSQVTYTDESVTFGIRSDMPNFPNGWAQKTIFVAGRGINKTVRFWGRAIYDLQEKIGKPQAFDPVRDTLGYWTDNGAAYYYNYEKSGLNNAACAQCTLYELTLLAVRDEFAQKGLRLGFIQLDSWHYPKGPNMEWSDHESGIYEYIGDQFLFHAGLKEFQRLLGLPIVNHAKWIDASSPYRNLYRDQTSGNMIFDSGFWNSIADYLQGVSSVTFEQDWLGSREAKLEPVNTENFLDNMARAFDGRLTMQYCMALPSHFLQSVKYEHLTTIRTSQDGFAQRRWDEFMYAGLLASALGKWSWGDVVKSNDLNGLILENLAGPVGIGDYLGSVNQKNLLLVARKDGIIVRPDIAITPTDSSIIKDANPLNSPMVAVAYSDFNGFHAAYVFAYARDQNGGDISFTPLSLGFSGSVYIYNYFTGQGKKVDDPDEEFSESLVDGHGYYIVVPITTSGIAVVGDKNQIVSLGRQRISDAAINEDGSFTIKVLFTSDETARTILAYTPLPIKLDVTEGKLISLEYNADQVKIVIAPNNSGVSTITLKP